MALVAFTSGKMPVTEIRAASSMQTCTCTCSQPSLGELLGQGKDNIDAWWLSMTTFAVLVGTLVLLIFIGEALREAMDTRRG